MSAISQAVTLKTNLPARSIALPVEHGAWGFLFEPALAGLVIAPSPAAPFILLLVVGAFLARQPLKFLLGDWGHGRWLPRTALALRFAVIFGGFAMVGLLGSLFLAPPGSFIPFVIVAPLVVYLIAQDIRISRASFCQNCLPPSRSLRQLPPSRLPTAGIIFPLSRCGRLCRRV